MKKLRPYLKRHMMNLSQRGCLKVSVKKNNIALRDNLIAEIQHKYRVKMPFRPYLSKERIPILIPKTLSLSKNYDETMEFINNIRDVVISKFLPVDLYFDQVQEVEPAAVMIMTAEIHRCRNIRKTRHGDAICGNYPNNKGVYKLLKDIGFFKLLKIVDDRSEFFGSVGSVALLPFITSNDVKPEDSSKFVSALVGIISNAVNVDAKAKKYLYGGIIEATKNAREHAYKLGAPFQKMGTRWWMTGSYDATEREFTIQIFDQGTGIPRTLEPDLVDFMESFAQSMRIQPSDSLMIQIATREGRTSTEQAGRGQGFMTMRKFVDACDDAALLIFSNRGHFRYDRKGTDRVDYQTSLGGTLVQWRVRHPSSNAGTAS